MALIHPAELTVDQVEEILGVPQADWAQQCHAVSLSVVLSGQVGVDGASPNGPICRVARGSTPGVLGQHSWVVFAEPGRPADCYNPDALVLDLTLWSYDSAAPVVYSDRAGARPHTAHGTGLIFDAPMPSNGGGEVVELTPTQPLSPSARRFLSMLGPLDIRGWMQVAHLPTAGWPAAEITRAMYETDAVRALVPIDLVGMRTDLNPEGLYLADDTNPEAKGLSASHSRCCHRGH